VGLIEAVGETDGVKVSEVVGVIVGDAVNVAVAVGDNEAVAEAQSSQPATVDQLLSTLFKASLKLAYTVSLILASHQLFSIDSRFCPPIRV
jgi:hypothetical protein